jgi:hypothetical protein
MTIQKKAYLREKKKHGAVTKQKARHRRWPRRRRSRQRKMMRTKAKAKARPNLKLTPRSEAKEQDATQEKIKEFYCNASKPSKSLNF